MNLTWQPLFPFPHIFISPFLSLSRSPSHTHTHTHTHTGRCTKTHTVDTCRFLSAAAWLAGMAYMKCLLNCRFLVGVIIQAYMHGREGLDFSPESSLPAFLPATSAGYCCELAILMDSPICFQRSFTYLMLKGFFFIPLCKPNKNLIICIFKDLLRLYSIFYCTFQLNY